MDWSGGSTLFEWGCVRLVMNACSIAQLCCLSLASASIPYVQDGMVCSSPTMPIKIRPTSFPPNLTATHPGEVMSCQFSPSILPSFQLSGPRSRLNECMRNPLLYCIQGSMAFLGSRTKRQFPCMRDEKRKGISMSCWYRACKTLAKLLHSTVLTSAEGNCELYLGTLGLAQGSVEQSR